MRDKRKPEDCRYYQIRRWSTGKTCGTYAWCPVKRARIKHITCPCDAWSRRGNTITAHDLIRELQKNKNQ
jgi:hypothetical protein